MYNEIVVAGQALENFFVNLAKYKGCFRVTSVGTIRTEARCCPIEQVAGVSRGFYASAGANLGLNPFQVTDIIEAADEHMSKLGTEKSRVLRKRLLNTLELFERLPS